MLDKCRGAAHHGGARWSMAAISNPVGGVRHSSQEAWTVRWAAVGEDPPGVVVGSTQWLEKTMVHVRTTNLNSMVTRE